MPIFLNKQGTNKQVSKAPSLTQYYSLLTGNPKVSRGWFNKDTTTYTQKLKTISNIATNIASNSGEPALITNIKHDPFFDMYFPDEVIDCDRPDDTKNNDELTLQALITKPAIMAYFDTGINIPYTSLTNFFNVLSLNTDDHSQAYLSTKPDTKVYLFGFTEFTLKDKKFTSKKLILPNLILASDEKVPYIRMVTYQQILDISNAFGLSNDDDNIQISLPKLNGFIQRSSHNIPNEIDMQSIYDTAIKYYFNTPITNVLTTIGQEIKDEQQILQVYNMIKTMQIDHKLNAIQLGTFVDKLLQQSKNVMLLRQKLLQYPELTFASLSKQFANNANQFTDLG